MQHAAFADHLCRPLTQSDIHVANRHGATSECGALLASPRRFTRHEMVFLEGDPAEHAYLVVEGAVRLHRTTSDGRRQIVGFACPGEWLALASNDTYSHTAETLTETRLSSVSRSELARQFMEDPKIAQCLFGAAMAGLRQVEDHLLMMGQKSALERVASFLVSYGSRLPGEPIGEDGWEIRLPMDRLDIADFLGLTIETVSRKFTQLKRTGVIALPTPSRVRIVSPTRLSHIAFRDFDASVRLEADKPLFQRPATNRALQDLAFAH